jgi:hypothetical protein
LDRRERTGWTGGALTRPVVAVALGAVACAIVTVFDRDSLSGLLLAAVTVLAAAVMTMAVSATLTALACALAGFDVHAVQLGRLRVERSSGAATARLNGRGWIGPDVLWTPRAAGPDGLGPRHGAVLAVQACSMVVAAPAVLGLWLLVLRAVVPGEPGPVTALGTEAIAVQSALLCAAAAYQLLPLRSAGVPMPGLVLLWWWRRPPLAERWLAVTAVTTWARLGLAPRDWPAGWVRRADIAPDGTPESSAAEWLVAAAERDHGEDEAAQARLEKAVAAAERSGTTGAPLARLLAAVAAGTAPGDPASATALLARARRTGPVPEADRLAVTSAILLAQGRVEAAADASKAAARAARRHLPALLPPAVGTGPVPAQVPEPAPAAAPAS